MDKEIKEMLDKMDDNELNQEVQDIKTINLVEKAKEDLIGLLSDRINELKETNELKQSVEKKLMQKIEEDEITVTQLISLNNSLTSEHTLAIDSVFSMFKPDKQGNVSPLVQQMITVMNQGDEKNAFEDLTKDQNYAISLLSRLIQGYMEEEKNGE